MPRYKFQVDVDEEIIAVFREHIPSGTRRVLFGTLFSQLAKILEVGGTEAIGEILAKRLGIGFRRNNDGS